MKSSSKTALNATAKASLRTALRAKTWEQKVAAIERMNTVSASAKASMKRKVGKS